MQLGQVGVAARSASSGAISGTCIVFIAFGGRQRGKG